uniref:Uncharacterized protein n=1 Tax=Aegilops tauschii subsp. strangulata TaxID=200361 RepID=A0A453DM50_AEGTS
IIRIFCLYIIMCETFGSPRNEKRITNYSMKFPQLWHTFMSSLSDSLSFIRSINR